MKKNSICFEEKLERIQEIAAILEDGTSSLDNMIQLYEEGMKLSIECREFLSKAEMKIENITAKLNQSQE